MQINNQILERGHLKPIVFDTFYNATQKPKPLVIFCHGYKGFKDWGCWNMVGNAFMEAGLFFVKFNFSHNGGTINNPIDFPDLEAFAENNYTKELDDLEAVIQVFTNENSKYNKEIDTKNITVIGHSRGGGIAILKASENLKINKLITWASVCNFIKRTANLGDLKAWKDHGKIYVLNGRTKQQMPHNYQFYQNLINNKNRLNIKKAAKKLKIPFLIIHSKDDASVKYSEAEKLKQWTKHATLVSISNSNHVFGAMHPYNKKELPEKLETVVKNSIQFILNH